VDDDSIVTAQREAIQNLPAIFETEPWLNVPGHTKSFISQLLVEGNARLTVKDAIKHRWVTGNDGGKYLEELYNKTIVGWSPRGRDFKLTEPLNARLSRHAATSTDHGDIVSCDFKPETVHGHSQYRLHAGQDQYTSTEGRKVHDGSSSPRRADFNEFLAGDIAEVVHSATSDDSGMPSSPNLLQRGDYRIVHTDGNMKYGYCKKRRAAPSSQVPIGDGFDGVVKAKKLRFASIRR